MKLDNETRKTSMTLEKQKQTITELRDEVKLQKYQCEQLEKEKSKLTSEANDKEKILALEYKELLEKSYSQNKTLESSLLHLKSELSLSESLRNELEERIAGNELELSALEDRNLHLQEEIETCSGTIKKLSDQEKNLLTENKYLEESVKNISDENKHLKDCCEKVQQCLATTKTTVAEKDRENNILQKKVLSDRETIHTLRNVALNSKSEMNDLRCQAVENSQNLEKVNKELEHERNTVSTLAEDKTDLEELYRLSQNLEVNIEKDLEYTRLQINKIRNENLDLKKENTSLHCKIQQEENTTKDLKSNIRTLSVEKLEINNMLTEIRRNHEQAKEDLYRVCSTVAKVNKTTKTVLNQIHAHVSESHLDIYSNEQDKNIEPSCSSLEPSVRCERSTTEAVCEELVTLEMTLSQIDSIFKRIITLETTLEKKINELTLVNKRLNDHNEKQLEEARILYENQENLVQKNNQLQTEKMQLAKEFKKVEEMLSNECTTTTEISEELSTLKDEKQRLCENNNELEVRLEQCIRENNDLNANEEKLKQEIQTLFEERNSSETRYATLCQEKREVDETAFKRKEQVLVLESDLKASVEFSEILEKRLTEEGDNSTRLRLRVETLDSQICGLEDDLKASLSQIKDMNFKVEFMNEEIRQTSFVLCEKEKEIARLNQELTRNDEKLKNSSIQVENYKTVYEDVINCQKETDEKLQQTELLLKRSENFLHQEKQLTNDLTLEKDNIEKELQSTIVKLQERVDKLMCEISVVVANEQTTKEDLESADDVIKQLENKTQEQLLQIKECEEQRKTTEVELGNLKLKYTATLAELDKMRNENEKLHEEKQELQHGIEELQAKITLHDQDRKQNLEEIRKLEIQFADEQKAKQIRQSALSTLQRDLESLKKQNSEKEKQIKSIMENKTAEIKQISEKLVEEKNKTKELQSNLNLERVEKNNLEQTSEDVSQEIFTLCQSVVKDFKSTEVERSCDHSLLEGDSDSVTDLFKMIGVVRSSHTLVKGQTDLLNKKIQELNKKIEETGKENDTLLVEKTQLEDALCRVQKECDIIQVDRNSLVKALETTHHDLDLKSSKIEALEDEINKLQQQGKHLKEAVKAKEEEYIVLCTKKEVMDKNRVSLEEEVSRLQSKLGNVIIELTSAKTTNEVLESENSELIAANSSLMNDNVSLQNKLNEAEKQVKKRLENLSQKENEILTLKAEISTAKKQIIATETSLQEQQSNTSRLKDDLKELERQKYDLENEMNSLRKLNEQMENVHKDLQLANSQIQADNSQIKRELECERTENLMKTASLRGDLEKAFTSVEKQNCKLSQVQNEKDAVQNQLLEAEKELKVLMEDNANIAHQMNQIKGTDKDELLTVRCQV